MDRKKQIILAAAAVTALLGGALWALPRGTGEPRGLPDLAAAAERAGYRVIPLGGAGVEGGFYAVPKDDARERLDLDTLNQESAGWLGVVRCNRPISDLAPSQEPVYRGETYALFGDPPAVRAFGASVGIH